MNLRQQFHVQYFNIIVPKVITGDLFVILLAGAMLIDCKRSGQENDKADKQTNFYLLQEIWTKD